MLSADFQTGSILHAATLVICAGAMTATPIVARRSRSESAAPRIRLLVGWGCIAAWLLNTIYWTMPARFDWGSSIPIHFCNVANIFGALAVVGRVRLFQGVIYFWGGLYIWAFLTPTVGVGPAHLGFWVFWIYHGFIALALVHVLVLDGFRPTWRDLLHSSVFTLAWVFLLSLVDRIFGWNYGFLGEATPDVPTPVDMLGPYPLRIVWMILIGAMTFVLMWLPFAAKRRRHPPQSTTTMRK